MSHLMAPRGSVRPVTMVVAMMITAMVVAAFAFSAGVAMTTSQYSGGTKVTVDTANLPDASLTDPDCYFQVGRQLSDGGKHTVVTTTCP